MFVCIYMYTHTHTHTHTYIHQQKWRVALARAAYSTAGILVLDDPLSALDARVSARVYDKLIVRFLRKRTRLVSTNQLEHALSRHVDSLLILYIC